MAELSKEFKLKFFSDLLRAINEPGKEISLQEGEMQFPGAPPITIKYVHGVDGHTNHHEAGFTVYVGQEKRHADWTEEAKIPLERYVSAAIGNDGVIATLLRQVVQDILQPPNRHTANSGVAPKHYSLNAHREKSDGPSSTRLRLVFHEEDAPAITARIGELRNQITMAGNVEKAAATSDASASR